MAVSVPLYWLIIPISLLLLAAGYALGRSQRASRSTPPKKLPPSPEPISNSALAEVQADQAALFSTLEKLTTTVKRLSSRQGMRDVRERSSEAPPLGTSKAELLRHYGMSGKVGPSFAQAQMEFETHNGRPN